MSESVELRPWLDGNIPAGRGPGNLLSLGRADVEVMFLERVGQGSARARYPVDSTNTIVAPLAEGTYFVGSICPAILGSDGRVAVVYPPLAWPDDDASPVLVGDSVVVQAQTLLDHAEIMGEIGESVAEINDFNATVVDPFIADTDQKLMVDLPAAQATALEAQAKALQALTDADNAQSTADSAVVIGNLARQQADGAVWVGPSEPPLSARVAGQVWVQTGADDRMVGVKVLRDHLAPVAVWDDYALLTGLLIVPGADGVPTIIDQNGLVVGTIMADAITTEVLAADSVGAKQLIIGEISREHLDAAVDGVLGDAEEWANRVVILPDSITISKSIVGSQQSLTALRLEATRLSFIVDNQPIAYMDSSKNLMSIGNALIQDSLQVGEHQVRRLGQDNLTIFQWVGV